MKLKAWLEANPFTLSLSSGYFGFFAHAGFVKALEENGLTPTRLTGASSGAIVAAAVAAGLTALEIEELVLRVKLGDFWDPALGLGFVRGKKFETLLGENIGRDFSVTQRPLEISAFNILKRKTEIFTTGNMARAVRASAAIPLMFHPVMINRQPFWDGGILDKMAVGNSKPGDVVLSHYLQGEKNYERYEGRRGLKLSGSFQKNRRVIILKNLARSGPGKLHLGPEILEAAYRQTLDILNSSL